MIVTPLIAAAALAQLQPDNNPVATGRLDQAPPPPVEVQKPRPKRAVTTVGPGTIISSIRFLGVDAPLAVAEAARTFLGRKASQDTLVELAGALSSAYEKTNVALYSIAIPDQDFRNGVVVVEVTEGWVDKVDVDAIAGPHKLLAARAGRLVGEKPLTRRRLERQMALIQAIPGLRANLGYENPEGDDSVALTASGKQDRFQAAFGINNRGPHLLGNTVLQGGVDAYAALVDGDQASASFYATPEFRHFRAIDLRYALPLGPDGFTLSASGGKIATKARKLEIKGEATFAAVALTYAVFRSANMAIDASVGIDGVNSNNALFGSIFTTERTRALRVAAALGHSRGSTDVQLTGAISHGLGIFRARADATGGETDFLKFNASAGLEHRFTPVLIGRIVASGQLSGDRLPGSELFSIGGPVIGRAFDTAIVSGDSGLGGLTEIAFRPLHSENFGKSELYAFADSARVKANSRLGLPARSFPLASAGTGFRVRYKDKMQFGLEAAAILDRPATVTRRDYRLNFAYSIKF